MPALRIERAGEGADVPFIDPQLCVLDARAPAGPSWVHEIKLDGYRLQVRVDAGGVTLFTRSGLDWTHRMPELAADASRLPDCVLDGELCALGPGDQPDFPSLVAALAASNTAGLVFFAFDALFHGAEDLRGLPQLERKARLQRILALHRRRSDRLRLVDHFAGDGPAIAKAACQMGLEGIVSKRVDAPYRAGPAGSWRKIKCRPIFHAVVGGWLPDRFGAVACLLVGVHGPAGDLTYVGRVGTGFSAASDADLRARMEAIVAESTPFQLAGPRKPSRAVRWLQPELVVDVAVTGWIGRKIRHGSFKGVREDLVPADAVLPLEAYGATSPARSAVGS